ncbi:Peptidyl-prolyl cis-trans isomerase NIMA-interacting 1 [Porphyridium purpureum]|uniref:Peptidyl-prolyl cis-trans isomerase n=1 Tax=Porphyridium purpureum TaxID=35688 RepID=A0A5J4YI48_PORPP|nr:Peptidyl-prolyl cis-trans isomerase NIMA-interacting 1 [Porphyridium purpureum]|eukprot:POR8984..scf297_16
MTSVTRVLREGPNRGRPPSEETTRVEHSVGAICEACCKSLVVGQLNYCHMNTVPDYLTIDVQKQNLAAIRRSSETVEASHLLVKHRGSRRPASWKNDNITISREEALAILKGFEKQIREGKVDFGELASHESDCSSAKNRGSLGRFGRGEMQKAFEDVAFGLKVGEMSGPVDTDSGVHLILRTG